jgi:hypothetical protein
MKTKRLSIKSVKAYFYAKPLRIAFAVLWLFFVSQIITSGFLPNPYALPDDNPEPHSYSMALVIILMISIILHLSLLVVIDVYMRSGWKFLIMLMITASFLTYFGMMAIHAPPSLSWMIMWTFLSFILFLILCFCQTFLFILRRSFGR